MRTFNERVRPIPTMTRRLVEVPFALDHPYWVSDGNFDPEFHVRHIALPKPGDWRQLCILISRLHARPLDRSRPLWEVYIIEGLDKVEGIPKGSFRGIFKNASRCHRRQLRCRDYSGNTRPDPGLQLHRDRPPSSRSTTSHRARS